MADRCSTCGSQAPHLHPAVQHEGEVMLCSDPFHRTVTAQNTPERIAEVELLLNRTVRWTLGVNNADLDRIIEWAEIAKEAGWGVRDDALLGRVQAARR